jgi:hypothetical protein
LSLQGAVDTDVGDDLQALPPHRHPKITCTHLAIESTWHSTECSSTTLETFDVPNWFWTACSWASRKTISQSSWRCRGACP